MGQQSSNQALVPHFTIIFRCHVFFRALSSVFNNLFIYMILHYYYLTIVLTKS